MSALRVLLVVIAGGYAFVLLLVYLLQDRFIFFPTREIFATPELRGLRYEDVRLVADDGVALHGWWIPAPAPRATVLYLHGNGGCLAHTLDAIETFARLGTNVLAIDYRGYGRSEGTPSGEGIMRDAEAAWRNLTNDRAIAPASIVIVGRSLGGGPASALAVRHEPAGLVLESTYTSVPDRAAELFSMLPARWVVRVRFDNRENVARVRCPVLVVHSAADETIPYHHGRDIFAAAHEPKELVTIARGHNDGFVQSAAVYVPALDRFIEQALRAR
jgi:fermentation-respiration switch protein FrsA (DUF1100 family)